VIDFSEPGRGEAPHRHPAPRTHLYLICSLRLGAGKTLLARLCTEFNRNASPPALPIDLGGDGRSALVQFLPTQTVPASITDIRGQMALFDRLARGDGIPKVVDIATGCTGAFFKIMHEIEFAAEARRRRISASILFVASPDEASIDLYDWLREQFPAFTLIPVYNEIVAYGRDVRRIFTRGRIGLPELQVPRLPVPLQDIVDRAPFSFARFRQDRTPGLTADLGLELDGWLRRIFRQLRELELSILINDLRPALTAGKGQTL
jgi:hypothetical protein